jgi:hypothetical protein
VRKIVPRAERSFTPVEFTLIYYLGDNPKTESIVLYIESIGDTRSFLSAVREVALTKPIIVIKAGCTEAAAKASVPSKVRAQDIASGVNFVHRVS